MNPAYIESLAKALAPVIKAAVAAETQKIRQECETLRKQVEGLPAPKDGKDCDMEEVRAMIEVAVKALPPPANGRDGLPGKDGNSVSLEEVRPVIDEAIKSIQAQAEEKVEAAIKSMPTPKDGKDGADGKDGKEGAPGAKGADGAGIADLLTDRDGALVATFTDGRMKSLGVIVGKDGAPGKDGRDGLGFDDLEVEFDGQKTITLKMQKGEVVKEANIVLPINIDRGIFREGQEYTAGDSVTWGGSYWIAQRDTGAKPDGPESGWRLAVKKGRDGKDGRNGIDKTTPVSLKD